MNHLRAALAAALLLGLAACSRVTADNYDKLQTGMTRAEVHALLGTPDEVSGGGIGRMTLMTERWDGRKHVISVTYAGDELAIKSIESRRKER
jgi:hypothetical protein